MRQLATIQTVKEAKDIPGKDRIKYINFISTGWHVIADSNIKPGDKVIYIEADSVLPIDEKFEFLRKRCYHAKLDGFVIRNLKMCGLYSEGIVFTLDYLPGFSSLPDGTDITDKLQIRLYETALEELTKPKIVRKSHSKFAWFFINLLDKLLSMFRPKYKYTWPRFMHKTDETRAQILPYIYEKYSGLDMIATEKADGQSFSCGIVNKRVYLCSRNVNMPITVGSNSLPNNHQVFFIENNLEKILQAVRKQCKYDFYIQGELVGRNIQGNKYHFNDLKLLIFNVKNVTDDKELSYDEIVNFYGYLTQYMKADSQIFVVPLVKRFKFNFKTIQELQEFAKGDSIYYKTPREGVVIRSAITKPADEKQANMLSFKVINPDFDLLHNK